MPINNDNIGVLKAFDSQECINIFSGKQRLFISKTMPNIAKEKPNECSYVYNKPFECCVYAKKPIRKFNKGLCLDNEKLGFVHKCNYEAAERYKMPVISGMIIGKFTCSHISVITLSDEYLDGFSGIEYDISDEQLELACITREEVNKLGNGEILYAWDVSDAKLYTTPYSLSVAGLTAPPHNFTYVNIVKGE